MARIFSSAFGPDPLFHVFFPHQDEYPNGIFEAGMDNFWTAWFDYRLVHVISYEISDDNEQANGERTALLPNAKNGRQKETITGMAQWERLGKGWEGVYGIWGWWDPRGKLRPCPGRRFD
jgi:hypothetical protein